MPTTRMVRAGTLAVTVLVAGLFFVPEDAEAHSRHDRENHWERIQQEREARAVKRVCKEIRRLYRQLPFTAELPAFCAGAAPSPAPEAPVVTLSAEPAAISEGGSATLSWSAVNVTSCDASGAWSGSRAASGSESVSPSADATYTLICDGAGGSDTESVSVTVTPAEPVPGLAHVVVSEIAWMGYQGDANNEWMELHNPTGSSVSLAGWALIAADGTPAVFLSGSIAAGGYYLLERTDDGSVSGIAADLLYTGALSNTSETLVLTDAATTTVDSVVSGAGWAAIGGSAATGETPQRTDTGTWVTAAPTPKAPVP